MRYQRSPSRAELEAAREKTVSDVIAPGLKVLFCGINPGLYTAAVGHHFGRPGNRFWGALFDSGFTPRLFHPSEQLELLTLGLGVTNVVARTTATADELSKSELIEGGALLRGKVLEYRPQWLAVLGIGAYRTAFGRPKAAMGPQDEMIGGTRVWALPNPSGLNAHFQASDLAAVFRELRERVDR
jgi:TDG/mug DNA glycosylase family protein